MKVFGCAILPVNLDKGVYMKKVAMSIIVAGICAAANASDCESITPIAVTNFDTTEKKTLIGMIQYTAPDAESFYATTVESSELNLEKVNNFTFGLVFLDTDGDITVQLKLLTIDESDKTVKMEKYLIEPQQNGSYMISSNDCGKDEKADVVLSSDGVTIKMLTPTGDTYDVKDPLGKTMSLNVNHELHNPMNNLAAIAAHASDEAASA